MAAGRVWLGLLAGGAALEAHALRSGRRENTLSACTRAAFRVHHPAGRATFAVGWVLLTCWWLPHITHGTCWPFSQLLPEGK